MRDGGAIIRSRTAAALLMVLGVMVLAVPDAARASSHVQLAPQGEDAAATASDDERKVLLQADSVTYDPNTETVVATGNVEAAFDERVLTADSLTYFRETEKVIAEGNVRLVESERIVVFGDRVELEDQLRIGVIESFSALLEDNARLIADQAVRREGNINELIRATYSACNVCDDEGNAKSPLWQIRDFRVIQEKEKMTIRY